MEGAEPRTLERLIETSTLPDHGNHDVVNAFLGDTYLDWWRQR